MKKGYVRFINSILNYIFKFRSFLYTIKEAKLNNKYNKCKCLNKNIQKNDIMQKFKELRNFCPAIKLILVPDSIWNEFKLKALEDLNEALHNYIVLIAFERGNLYKLTFPIHRFLLNDDGTPKRRLTKQYRNDLQERWMLKDDKLERHQDYRRYCGKLYELLIAAFLVINNWTVTDLAALEAKYDIIAISPSKIKYFFEMKYIGQQDEVFQEIVKSIKDERSGGAKDYCKSSDYLLFRVYEAAKQFNSNFTNSLVIVVISNMHWDFVDEPIKEENWINWKSPQFFDNNRDFIMNKIDKYPDIFNELKSIINSLSELWIIKEENSFEFSLQRKVCFNKCT